MCSYAFLRISQKHIVHVGKSKVTATKEQRTAQAGCTTTTTERRAHRTAHFTDSSQESRSLHIFHRLPWDAVYSRRCG